MEAEVIIDTWISEFCNRQTSKTCKLKGQTPLEVFEKSIERVKRQENFKKRKISPGKLAYLMLGDKQKTLYKNGIKMFGDYYYNPELYYYAKGTKFDIKYDIHNSDKILVFLDNKYICEARQNQKVHPAAVLGDQQDRDTLSEQIRIKKHLEKTTINTAKQFIENNRDILISERNTEVNNIVLPPKPTTEDDLNDTLSALANSIVPGKQEDDDDLDDLIVWESLQEEL